jgi:hypothetical protein
MNTRKVVLITVTLALGLFFASCAGESLPAPPEAIEATAETSPAAVIVAETEALQPERTATSEPAAAPEATASPSPPATATEPPEETATPEATAEPSATPFALPDGWYGPDNYPENMNPLTGEIMDDPSVLDRRPIAIKVSNYPALVRPQAGLNNADLVFEHYAEGGATRFTAVFYGKDAHTVGSVRSARIIDFEIPVMYDAAFGFSGAAGPNKERFGQVEWFEQIISPDFGNSGFYRAQPEDPDTDFWHTMFTDTYRLREILIERGIDVAPQFQNGMIFAGTMANGTMMPTPISR